MLVHEQTTNTGSELSFSSIRVHRRMKNEKRVSNLCAKRWTNGVERRFI